eukprot:6374407-Prymnesium_polylepis.1
MQACMMTVRHAISATPHFHLCPAHDVEPSSFGMTAGRRFGPTRRAAGTARLHAQGGTWAARNACVLPDTQEGTVAGRSPAGVR